MFRSLIELLLSATSQLCFCLSSDVSIEVVPNHFRQINETAIGRHPIIIMSLTEGNLDETKMAVALNSLP